MEYIKQIVIYLLLPCAILIAQGQWVWQNPQPQGNALTGIHLFPDGEILAAGQYGTLVRSSNNGLDWDVQHYALGEEYHEIDRMQFVDDNTGWALNHTSTDGIEHKYLYYTTDRGESWETRNLPDAYVLDLFALDGQQAWIAGTSHNIYHTTDGGFNWTTHEVAPAGEFEAYGIFFLDQNTGWVVGQGDYYQGKIFNTTDGGLTWTEIFTNPDFNTGLGEVFFLDENTGWVGGGDALIMGTTDGGQTWTTQYYQDDTNFAVLDMYFFDAQNGIAVGTCNPEFINGEWVDQSLAVSTSDGGATWEQRDSGTDVWIRDLHPADNSTVWACGDNGLLIRSDDGGQTWTPISRSVTDSWLYCVDFIDEMTGFAGGWDFGAGGLLFRTDDGGENWFAADTGEYQTTAVHFLDQNNGFRVEIRDYVYRTRDGGHSWERYDALESDGLYFDASFADTSTGWLLYTYLGDGYVYKTTDGAHSWQTVLSTPEIWLAGIDFLNADTGWVSGAKNFTFYPDRDGYVYKTTDGGATWQEQLSGVAQTQLGAIDFVDHNTGWVIGATPGILGHGVMLATTDGGDSWSSLTIPLNQPLGISFLDANNGWIFGNDGTARTLDGGLTWETFTMPDGPGWGYDAVYFTSPDNGWLVGSGGHILKFEGGATPIVSHDSPVEIPKTTELHQNYPNPFNPETAIRYSLSIDRFVRLEIYDVAGRKVKTAVNERRSSGIHEYIWDGTDETGQPVASGIYFYQLASQSAFPNPHSAFVSARKMILLR